MDNTITLKDYILYSGNLFKCIFKRTTILQAKVQSFDIGDIIKDRIIKMMEELINDTLTLEMETKLEYPSGFPHSTYWGEVRMYIDKYRTHPWQMYKECRERLGNGIYAAFVLYYARGLQEDLQCLEGWAQQVRI
jgi:hypothetical protein